MRTFRQNLRNDNARLNQAYEAPRQQASLTGATQLKSPTSQQASSSDVTQQASPMSQQTSRTGSKQETYLVEGVDLNFRVPALKPNGSIMSAPITSAPLTSAPLRPASRMPAPARSASRMPAPVRPASRTSAPIRSVGSGVPGGSLQSAGTCAYKSPRGDCKATASVGVYCRRHGCPTCSGGKPSGSQSCAACAEHESRSRAQDGARSDSISIPQRPRDMNC